MIKTTFEFLHHCHYHQKLPSEEEASSSLLGHPVEKSRMNLNILTAISSDIYQTSGQESK